MEVLHRRCAGLDVHQRSVVACVRVAEGASVQREVRSFGTTTAGLLELADWLRGKGVSHAVMESTGVYWKPVWHILEGSCELILANAQEVRNLPGRKSDVSDAEWLSDLLAHGLIRSSFVPPVAIQELRDLTRTRVQLVGEITRHTQRIQKTLEDANIKLTGVVSDVLGKTGRAILKAMIGGETDLDRLVELRRGTLKATREELRDALRGRLREHHRFLLRLHLDQIEALETAVRGLEARMGQQLEPFRESIQRLITIPGVSETTARVILAEIGLEMERFPTAGHLVSWAGLAPRNDESAGKHRSRRLRPGNRWLKRALVQAAWAATRKRDSYLQAQYQRIRRRRGGKRAVVAVAASILVAVYHMLHRQTAYQDLGSAHFDHRSRHRTAQRLLRRLADLGYTVEVRPAA